jgi:predicted MFS family arabinose efflux permease
VLGVAGLVCLTWALHGVPEHGWSSTGTVLGLVGAGGALVACVRAGRRSGAPLVPGSLLRDRAVMVSDACGAVVGAALMGTFYFLSLHLQQVQGYSPSQAAWSYLPLVGGLVLAAGVGSAVLPRVGSRPLLVLGQVGCAKGLVLLAVLGLSAERTGFWTGLLPGLLVSGAGLGLAFVALTATAVPGGEGAADGGVASGLYNTSVQVGGALGIAVLSGVARARTEAAAAAEPLREAVTSGRVTALLVGAGVLVLGAALASFLPREAGRRAGTDEAESLHAARTA